MFKACIFDLDGTLLYTIEDLAASADYALRKHGYPTYTLEDYTCFVGNGIRKLVERCLPVELQADREKVEAVYTDFQDYYAHHYLDRSHLYPGVEQTVREIASRGVQIGVLSNKDHRFTVDIIRSFFDEKTVPGIFGIREGVPHKPDPTAVFEMLRQFGTTPEETAFVGDSNVDMQTAKNAGCYPVGVSWGYRSVPEIIACGAKIIVTAPEELLRIF